MPPDGARVSHLRAHRSGRASGRLGVSGRALSLLGCSHEVFEERELGRVVNERLRMPLDAQQERLAASFDALDHAVLRPRDRVQAASEAGDALVMERVDGDAARSEDARQVAAGGDAHLVRGDVAPSSGWAGRP